MDESDSQKRISNNIIAEDPDTLSVSISDSELTIILQAGGCEAAYTAEEARYLARSILSTYHQHGWGHNIVPTADYIYDLADVVDNKTPFEDIEQKWDHDGERGGNREYTIVADGDDTPIMSFDSKTEAICFCETWNGRASWVIEYHIKRDGQREAIWNLTVKEGEMVAERLEDEIAEAIHSEDGLDWDIAVSYEPEIPSRNGTERIFRVGVRNLNSKKERYQYQIYYSASEGGGVNTLTQQAVTPVRRVRIDRHRGRILEIMSAVPKRLGLYFGPPNADLELLNLGPVISEDQDFP